MSQSVVILEACQDAIWMAVLLGGPLLLAAVLAGLTVGLLQTMTQMQEPAIGVIARVLAVAIVLMILVPWLVETWMAYWAELIHHIPDWV